LNSTTGLPVASPTITVNITGGSAATIYSDEGVTPKSNPFTGDSLGRFDFYVADGDYDIIVAGSGLTSYTIVDVTVAESTRGGFVVDSDHIQALLANAIYNAGTAQYNRVNTGRPAWRTEADSTVANDYWRVLHAVAAANPITWTEFLRLTNAGHFLPGATANLQDLGSTGAIWRDAYLTSLLLRYGGAFANQSTTSGVQIRSGSPIAAGSGVLLWLERHADGGDFNVRTSNAAGTADITRLNIPGATNAPVGADDGPSVDWVDVAEVALSNSFPGAAAFRSSPQHSLVGTHDTTGEHQWQTRVAMLSVSDSEWRLRRIFDGAAAVNMLSLSSAGVLTIIPTTAIIATGAANRCRMLQSMARVTKSATQAITANTDTAVAFDVETVDTDTLHDNVTNNTRLTAAIAGKYLVTGFVEYDTPSVAVTFSVWIRKQATTTYARTTLFDSSAVQITATALVNLAAGEYVELMTRVGEARTLQSGTSSTAFSMVYIGE